MAIRNTDNSYGSVAKFFHWLIFILVTIMLIVGFTMDGIANPALKGLVFNIHKLTGVSVLMLMILRALWAATNPKPELFAANLIQRLAERIGHFILYALLIIMPLSGWVAVSAAGRPPKLGDMALQLPIPQSKALVKQAFTLHGLLAYVIIVFVILHIFAALYHHFIKKDEVLKRMMPRH
jgi:cytochrome b561